MKLRYKISLVLLWMVCLSPLYAQHHSTLSVVVHPDKNTLEVAQELVFYNASPDTLHQLVLNDWNNAYTNEETPLAKRFSDEFNKSFHLAKEAARGSTMALQITNENNEIFSFSRPDTHPDLVTVALKNGLLPNQRLRLQLRYTLKLPSTVFTGYGFEKNGKMNLKNAFITPARYENKAFISYSNENIDDCANAASDYDLELKMPDNFTLQTDLNETKTALSTNQKTWYLSGKNRLNFSLYIDSKIAFEHYKNDLVEVVTDLKSNSLNEIQKAILIDKMVRFVKDNTGAFPNQKIIVSQTDYEHYPFYGLNQLPSFLSPFPDDFIYEIKFLKTYLNQYFKSSLNIDSRKDNWISDGFQVYLLMKYIDENYPNSKMMGSIAKLKILKAYHLINLGFNEQYSYFYMLTARKNLDQPLGNPKNTLIKFNEQIASKYRAGISFKYLDSYLEKDIVSKSMQDFYTLSTEKQTSRADFESIVKQRTSKNIDWFFKTIIDTRDWIDYKFGKVSKTNDSITFTIKNKTQTNVPIPVYGFNNKEIVFKKWFENIATDSTFTIPRSRANRIVLNYKNEVPEFNLRNNWKKLDGFFPNNRPLKFIFFEDLEDPNYNQVSYVPTLAYNLYDGLSPGIELHNKNLLNKPFNFDLNPAYSTTAKSLTGGISLGLNQNFRNSKLYNIRYTVGASYAHYAPDAGYSKINPAIAFRFRDSDFRNNRFRTLMIRQVILNREKLELNNAITSNQNYNVFNIKYFDTKTEITRHFNFISDFQLAGNFGKLASEIQYRKLFKDDRQISIRLYAGTFLYNTSTTDFFSFALDRPTDYLFDYNYLGRSESTGLFSQQIIMAEGGFKSKLNTSFANQWIATLNGSFNVWNWVEVYGDVGVIKNQNQNEKIGYDNGIRLNLVTDYFELFFPVYSNNGWEIAQPKYGEKIRFMVTVSPRILINLFTRKWF